MSSILAVIVGVVSSSIVAFFVEWQRQARLTISIGPPKDHDFREQGAPAGLMRGLRVLVRNESVSRFLPFLKRDAAHNCRATLRFLHLDGTDYITREMPGRWVASIEPVSPEIHLTNGETGTLFDIARLNQASEIDIPAGESELLDVATRCDSEPDCYGFNNESYKHHWRTPHWRLPTGRYKVEVTVRSEGQKVRREFLLENDHSREQMRLEDAQILQNVRRGRS